MKNISLTINPTTSYPVPPPMPAYQQAPATSKENPYTVSFSIQFSDADKAMMFAKTMIGQIQNYGN